MSHFHVQNLLFSWGKVSVSYLEFYATLFGLVAVWMSAKENIWSWIWGLINVCLAFWMFYQIHLYPDMFLQVFFFITNLVGFYFWKYPNKLEENSKKELKITTIDAKNRILLGVVILLFVVLFGTFSKNLNIIFPALFSQPSSFPYLDSFTTIASVFATFFLMKKKLETWWCWLFIDIISTGMYFQKDLKLYALLYLLFCGIALFGALEWTRKYRTIG
ncbi:MAG: nicotinamide riboside transporter PnuC [Leadbetterella sp.]